MILIRGFSRLTRILTSPTNTLMSTLPLYICKRFCLLRQPKVITATLTFPEEWWRPQWTQDLIGGRCNRRKRIHSPTKEKAEAEAPANLWEFRQSHRWKVLRVAITQESASELERSIDSSRILENNRIKSEIHHKELLLYLIIILVHSFIFKL